MLTLKFLENLKNLKIEFFEFLSFLSFWDFSIFEIFELHEYSIAGIRRLVKGVCQSLKCLEVFHRTCGKTCGNVENFFSTGLGGSRVRLSSPFVPL
jgi:hypothetical protein